MKYCRVGRMLVVMLAAVLYARAVAAEVAQSEIDGVVVTGVDDPHLRPFDTLMVNVIREHEVPGAALAISRRGVLVYARGFGYADVQQSRAVLPTTLFRIASLSKPITAAAVLSLVLDGKIDLDDRMVRYVNCKRHCRVDSQVAEITIRQLLQHRGGWDRDAGFDPMFKTVEIGTSLGIDRPANQQEIIEYMLQRPLDFAPGRRYAYSNFGYCLLGRVIEHVTGMTYEQYVQQRIMRPLGITTARLGRTTCTAEEEAKYYTPQPDMVAGIVPGVMGKEVPRQYGGWCLENMDSHGGWIASAPDLVKFADCFAVPDKVDFLNTKLVALAFTPAEQDRDKDVFYGFGWRVRRLSGGRVNTWHTGSLTGTSTLLVRRHDGLNWAVLFNQRNGNDGKRLSAIIDPLVDVAARQVKQWPCEKVPIRNHK